MRITRPIAFAFLLGLAPGIVTHPALAQAPAADDPVTPMARARFKEGVEFYDKGEFDQARASFLQAYALRKHPAVLLNLAWSCLKSGHPLEADRYFRQFLSEGRDINEKQRADANDGLTQARAKLGRIEIVASAGTDVTVDGERAGSAPIAEPVSVEGGAHTVKFRSPDGQIETQSITVLAGEKTTARLRTASAPPSAPAPAPSPAPTAEEPAAPAAAPSPAPAPTEEPARRPTRAPAPPAAVESVSSEKKSLFAAPKNWTPVIVLGLGAVAGYGAGAAMYVFKQSAQDKANSIAAAVNMAGGGCPAHPDACTAYNSDVSNVNDDATIGNVALGVGVAATIGAIVYWLVSDKQEDAKTAARSLVLPLIGPSLGGASLAGQF
jgi:tetratricopeptide (TPR) repeat protein